MFPLQMCAKPFRYFANANLKKTQFRNCCVSIEEEMQLESHVNKLVHMLSHKKKKPRHDPPPTSCCLLLHVLRRWRHLVAILCCKKRVSSSVLWNKPAKTQPKALKRFIKKQDFLLNFFINWLVSIEKLDTGHWPKTGGQTLLLTKTQ